MKPIHSFKTLVWWSETDAAGIMHFSSIFKLCEWAEEDFIKKLTGKTFKEATAHRIIFPRVHASCDFIKPLYAHEEAKVNITSISLGKSSITWIFDVYNESRGYLAAKCKIVTVAVDRFQMKSVEIPKDIRDLLEKAGASNR